ncbi:hypothetical protein ACP_0364 [Acidobacterium capsulatum ATCC 51196]|uniref:Uncharacterized protein n=1 Tax=Acidobacterium capsulatum (strain ATCC 51196 / DSM 11244 / BCRC 80197 / JCM 7670 / NBRC 15755 / NCIMB 13165 / 161) TaxID=240015 RepID=C1F9Y7_ACIC5|nr:hypothetical protein ACP_0364 [Acidobacterium capsulatum ATCC 51196]
MKQGRKNPGDASVAYTASGFSRTPGRIPERERDISPCRSASTLALRHRLRLHQLNRIHILQIHVEKAHRERQNNHPQRRRMHLKPSGGNLQRRATRLARHRCGRGSIASRCGRRQRRRMRIHHFHALAAQPHAVLQLPGSKNDASHHQQDAHYKNHNA